jgi:hypothetical protein
MPKYKVLSPIKTGPKPDDVLSIGEEAEFTAKEAKELIACGALKEATEPVSAKKGATK